jgi:hypothetical protein
MKSPHLHTHDPRAELLGIVGILATAAGAALALLLGLIKRPMPDAIGVIALFTMAAILTVGGIWLTLRRRWAGMLIATTSLLTAAGYFAMLSRCHDCSAGVLLANITIGALFGTPGALIIRWRRFLR